jgi:hypothetical protein
MEPQYILPAQPFQIHSCSNTLEVPTTPSPFRLQ